MNHKHITVYWKILILSLKPIKNRPVRQSRCNLFDKPIANIDYPMMLIIIMENISVFSEKWSSAKLMIKGVIVEAADLTEKYKLN